MGEVIKHYEIAGHNFATVLHNTGSNHKAINVNDFHNDNEAING